MVVFEFIILGAYRTEKRRTIFLSVCLSVYRRPSPVLITAQFHTPPCPYTSDHHPPVCYSSSCAAGALWLTSPLLTELLLTGSTRGQKGRTTPHYWHYAHEACVAWHLPKCYFSGLLATDKATAVSTADSSSFIVSRREHEAMTSQPRAFAKSSCQLCSKCETITEELAHGSITAVYEDNLLPFASQYAPAQPLLLWVCSCDKE